MESRRLWRRRHFLLPLKARDVTTPPLHFRLAKCHGGAIATPRAESADWLRLRALPRPFSALIGRCGKSFGGDWWIASGGVAEGVASVRGWGPARAWGRRRESGRGGKVRGEAGNWGIFGKFGEFGRA